MELIDALPIDEIVTILESMPADDVADLIGKLPEEKADAVLEKMRKEMETLSNARRSTSVGDDSMDSTSGFGDTTAGDGATAQGDSASGSTPGEQQHGSQQASRSESGTGSQSQDSTGQASNPTSQGRRGGAPRPGIPDGSDDDIVARQLREAAEAETDPVLREKLWEEYTNYKKGSS